MVRIYIEGAGNDKQGNSRLRKGLKSFLCSEKNIPENEVRCIPAGSRNKAYAKFLDALETHRNDFVILLVDAESKVIGRSAAQHLIEQDAWNALKDCDENCHLMVQVMESWFLADIDALKRFYGPGFNANAIPGNPRVEAVPKADVLSALRAATRNTPKQERHKTKHGFDILARVDARKVRQAAGFCDQLFCTLEAKTKEV